MAKCVYALVGTDSFLQQEKLAQILAELPRDAQRVDLDGERSELADVLDELRSFSLFGSFKAVVLRNADAFVTRFREPLENYLASPAPDAALVMRLTTFPASTRLHKVVQKIGVVEPCSPPKNLGPWIAARARQVHGVSVGPDAARMLADLIGDDMGRLDNELAKLALLADGKAIDADMVRRGVAFQRDQDMWEMTDQLAAGRPAEAVRRWRLLVELDSSAEFRAVTWLTMWLEKTRSALAMTRKGMGPAAIGQQLKIWSPDMQRSFVATAVALGDPGVARAVDLLAQVDYQSKTGVGSAAENVERFLLTIAGLMTAQGAGVP